MEAESLYYTCCDRIDQDIEVAESFLVGCIAYIIRERGEKGVRQKIKDDLCMNYYEPYLRELRLISTMHDDSIHALITSSLDLSAILKQVEIVCDHAMGSNYDLVQESTHANKAKRIGEMMTKLSEHMKPTRKIRTDCGLFAEGI